MPFSKVKDLFNPRLSFEIYTSYSIPEQMLEWCQKHNFGSPQNSVMMQKLLAHTPEGKNVFVIAKQEINGIPHHVGWALLSKDYGNQYNIYVLPEYRNQGIGEQIISFTLKNKLSPYLTVDAHNMQSFNFFDKVKKTKGSKIKFLGT